MWIQLIPNDTLFFRTGRPFEMGAETEADTIFPPYPSTIYGALRTFLIFHRGGLKSFREGKYADIGTPFEKGNMRIIGPFLFDTESETIYLPTPLDLVKVKSGEYEKRAITTTMTKRPDIIYTDEEFEAMEEIFLYKGRNKIDQIDGYIDDITLEEYLCSTKQEKFYVEKDRFYMYETKVGIARNYNTLTSRVGYLYRVSMIRLRFGISLLVRVDCIEDMPESGILQLGGEGKTVKFKKVNYNPLERLEKINFDLDNRRFKLYLATPAIFKKGWLPEWIDERSLIGEKSDINGEIRIRVRLISCIIGKYIRIGGWNMAERRPKQMYKAVPAGSVYCFEILDSVNFEDIKKVFHCKNISDIYSEEGYGFSLIGKIF